MVRDTSSRNEHEGSAADGGTSDRAGHTTSNLTQELAQLLALSIAQNQAARGHAGGAPTGAELTSLANLVSAAAGQRTLAPVFKDGLSALSYAPPPANPVEPPAAEHPELHHDDEPMPIPSTWRQPKPSEDDPWFRQQMGAAVLGLIAGLVIVVPAVLWLSGWLGPQKAKPAPNAQTAATATEVRSGEIKTVKVQVRPVEKPSEVAAQYVTGSMEPRPVAETKTETEQNALASPAKLVDPRVRAEELIAQAMRRVERGDVTGAREMLATANDAAPGPVNFTLAETYDPNMLAAWGSRGVAADVAKARALYRKALDLGVPRAQARLDQLK